MKKRLIATFLALCLCIGLLPTTALAADATSENGYFILSYDDGGIEKSVTVNLIDPDGKQIDTLTVNNARGSQQEYTIGLTDSISNQYDIESISIDGGNPGSQTASRDSYKFFLGLLTDSDSTITVYLCPEFEAPYLPDGEIEYGDNDDISYTRHYRLYEDQILKMLHANHVDVSVDTEIVSVQPTWVSSFSEDHRGFDAEHLADEDYWNLTVTSDSADLSEVQPNNIRKLTITYDNGNGEQTIDIYSGDLRYPVETGTAGVTEHYNIELDDDTFHIVYFYDVEGVQTTIYSLYDIVFVKHDGIVGDEMPDDPTYPETARYEFVAWTETPDGGIPFLSTTPVTEDTVVYAQKALTTSNSPQIRVMNNGGLLVERLTELFGGQFQMDSVKIAVHGKSGDETNPDYDIGLYENGWSDNESYYFVYNYLKGATSDQENDPVHINDIDKIIITAQDLQGNPLGPVEIHKGVYDGDFWVSTGTYGSDMIIELYINDNDVKNPDPEPEDPAITGFEKALVASEAEATEAGITGTYDYPNPDKGNKVIISNEEGATVTLLYAITVEGEAGTTFTVTDEGAELVEVNSVEIEQSGNTFTGTIPTGETSITFYVSKEFTAADIKNDKLTNSASIDSDDGVKEDEEEAEEETPAEPEDLNGTDVTVQVFVDGNSTPVTDPLDYVNLSRVTHDTHKGWHVSGPDPSGMLTCDFDYDAGAANGGYDCVDIRVDVKDDTYVLQGVQSYQSYGSKGTDNVIDNENGTYTIDNVTGKYDQGDTDDGVDVKIYLRTKYTVKYYENDVASTTVTDDGAYIADEDIESTTLETEKPSKENGSAWMDWKNTDLQTSITVAALPTVAGTVTGWWLNDAECSEGGTLYGPDTTDHKSVDVSTAIVDLTGSEIKFYAKVEGTGNTATEYHIMNLYGELEAITKKLNSSYVIDGFTIRSVTGNPTDVDASGNGWAENKEYYTVKNGEVGDKDYVPYNEANSLDFCFQDQSHDTYYHTYHSQDLLITEPVGGISEVYVLFDIKLYDDYNYGYWYDVNQDGTPDWVVHKAQDFPSERNYVKAGSRVVLGELGGRNTYYEPTFQRSSERDVIFLGWAFENHTTIYEPGEEPEGLIKDAFTVSKEVIEKAVTPIPLTVNLYGVYGYASPLFDVDKALTKVVRNGGEVQDDLAGLTLYPGDELTWTITVTNGSNAPVTGLKLTDTLKASGTIITDGVQVTAPEGVDPNNFTVGANDNVVFTVTYTVKETDVNTTLTNSAEVTSPNGEGPGDEDETENPVANPKLTVTKTADKTTASAGDEITYTVTVTNTGDAPLTDVTVKDDMWAREDNYPIQIDDNINYAANGEFTLKTPIAPNASVTITYTYIVKEADVTTGNIVNRVTVDGGEEGGPGGDEETVWTGKVTITPADIVIYTGGTGYSGVVNAAGEVVGDTVTGNGLPRPGYHLVLPTAVTEWINNKGGSESSEADAAERLDDILTFTYHVGDVERTWNLNYLGIHSYNEDDSVAAYVYSMTEKSNNPVSLRVFEDKDGDKEFSTGDVTVTTDDIAMSQTAVSAEYLMTIDGGPLDQKQVKCQFTIDGDSITCNVEIGTGTLTVKSTTNSEYTNEIGTVDDNLISAVAGGDVTYLVNDSEVEVENTNNRVQLLVDSVSNNVTFDEELEADAISEVRADGISLSDALAQSFYLDLVDTDNGHAVVTLADGDKLTIYWPMPDDADPNGEFHIVHYTEMKREDVTGTEDLANAINKVEEVAVTRDGDHLTFQVGSFSPFVLVYEKDDGGSRPSRPSGGNSGSSSLNTKDHYAYIVGYPDGTVQPQGSITRAEVATIFFRLLTDDAREDNWSQRNSFIDVSEDDWFNNAVSTLTRMGILDGYEDGTFQPNAPITRAEFTKVAVSFFDYAEEDYRRGTFSDVDGSEWYADFIAAAVELGLIEGYGDDTFRPNGDITRAEACTLVNRTLDRAPHEDHLLPRREMNTWSDNPTSAWYYEAIQEATNSHDYRMVTEDGERVENWTEKLEDRDWTELERSWSDASDAPGGEVMD